MSAREDLIESLLILRGEPGPGTKPSASHVADAVAAMIGEALSAHVVDGGSWVARFHGDQKPIEVDLDEHRGQRFELTDTEGRETAHQCEACGWPLRACDLFTLDEDGVALCMGCKP